MRTIKNCVSKDRMFGLTIESELGTIKRFWGVSRTSQEQMKKEISKFKAIYQNA